jgi:hypothetical protein
MRRFVLIALAAAAGAVLSAAPAAAGSSGKSKLWRVTVENLTPPGPGAPGSQPLSPPLFVIHSKRAHVWSVGDIASHGVAAIAEDANNSVLESALNGFRGVKRVWTGAGGPIPSGESRRYMVRTRGTHDRLTLLTMLVNTNDGFTGLDSLRLRGRRMMLVKMAYDAGSEKNNELAGFIPGPCCSNPFVRDPEGEVIRMHEGITGRGTLAPAVYGWSGAAIKITIRRA